MIKLYRSTVSERNNIDWIGSIKADFNPYGPPGPLDPDRTLHYEKLDLESHTIPLWVAYVVLFEKTQEKSHLHAAVQEFLKVSPQVILDDNEKTYDFLHQQAEKLKELPQYKIASDIAFVGHSLGATLSEHYLAKQRHRIPLPGCSFICYSANAPALDDALDAEFMKFGRAHKALFQALHVRWKITRQLEYGDIFVQGGYAHLGTTEYQPADVSWLEQKNFIFRPKEEAEAFSITTLPTHGRRIGGAIKDKDYTLVPISPSELYEFDHSWWLSHKLRSLFGFRLLYSPRFTEKFRQTVGRIAQPLFTVLERKAHLHDQKIMNRDEKGILFARYVKLKL